MYAVLRKSAAVLALLLAGGFCIAAEPEPAALPEQSVDVTIPQSPGETLLLKAGDSLQEALDRAQPGDVIELEAGAEFRGPFTLPNKQGEGWIVVRSAAHDHLPAAGTRIEAQHTATMPVLSAAGNAVLTAAPGAHHYRFIGIEIRPVQGEFLHNLVELGTGSETDEAQLAHHVIFDRCYLHGDPAAGTRRGIALNSAHTAVIDSRLTDFKEQGNDSQALAGWGGPGPFLIRNNLLEAAGENIMFGGGTPGIEGLVPSDIEVRGNHLLKNLKWKQGEPGFEGKAWTVKNLFELKNARRVLVDGNVLENNWTQSQNGIAILLTVRNEDGAMPWAVVEDVTFTNNVIMNVPGGFNILGHDDNGKSRGGVARIVIRNNLFKDMEAGRGPLFQLLEGASDLTIERNTALNPANIILADGAPTTDVRFTGNIVKHNEYGIIGSGTGPGNQTIERYLPDAIVTDNVIVGGNMRSYPEGNTFPVSESDVGFRDMDAGDYRLAPRGGETINVGADLGALCAAFAPSERASLCTLRAR